MKTQRKTDIQKKPIAIELSIEEKQFSENRFPHLDYSFKLNPDLGLSQLYSTGVDVFFGSLGRHPVKKPNTSVAHF